VLNVITGLFPPEEEPCNPFTVAIEIAEIPTPAPANCVNVIAVPAPPTVIESFVVKTHAVSARVSFFYEHKSIGSHLSICVKISSSIPYTVSSSTGCSNYIYTVSSAVS
jgi:hypothetical protein